MFPIELPPSHADAADASNSSSSIREGQPTLDTKLAFLLLLPWRSLAAAATTTSQGAAATAEILSHGGE